jgi:hypothetical protein
MKQYCTIVYRHMQMELQQSASCYPCMLQKTEHGFAIVYRHWHQVKQKLIGYHFTNEGQEIEFFKNLKPLFTSEIEYYALLYHSLLFEPSDGQPAIDFWKREHERLQKFENENRHFLSCYVDAHCPMLPFYFLRKCCLPLIPVELKLYDDGTSSTNGDGLVATWLALKKYTEHTKQTGKNN